MRMRRKRSTVNIFPRKSEAFKQCVYPGSETVWGEDAGQSAFYFPILPPSTPDNAKPTDEMVAEAGYPVETHIVPTDDGYLLSVHRIPSGRVGGQVEGPRPTVFLQHGLLSSSADWVSFFQHLSPSSSPFYFFYILS